MVSITANRKLNVHTNKDKFDPKYLNYMYVLFTALILGRALYNAFFYIFVGISTLVFIFSNVKYSIPLLLFLLPLASILKSDVNDISFFTILFFIVILKLVLIHQKIDAKLFLYGIIFFIYCVAFSGLGQITTIVTLIAGLISLYYLRYSDIDECASVTGFSYGIILSSFLAFFKNLMPIINVFVTDNMLKLDGDSYGMRFSGLQGNPNYYTLDIIIALSAILLLINNSKIKISHITIFVILSVFGLMSVSKSFLVTWIILLFILFVLSIRQGLNGIKKLIFIIFIGLIAIYYFAYDSVNTYLFRFFEDSSASLDDITTGRLDIWIEYLNTILNDLKILFLGNGINTILESVGKGTHNTYIESIFYLGILGTFIFLVALKRAIGKISLRSPIIIIVLMLLIRMFAIGILTYDNLWFYLYIIVILKSRKNINMKTERENAQC